MDLNTAFRILETEESADLSEVRRAYRDLAEIWHPDKYAHKPRLAEKAVTKMKEINCAYDLIQEHFKNNQSSSKAKPANDPDREEAYIVCLNCGITNRIPKNFSKANLKCGGCGKNPNVKESPSESKTKCVDESCGGPVSPDGRCFKCGKKKQQEEEPRSKRTSGMNYHPWRRLFSRMIDSLGGVVLLILIVYAWGLLLPSKATELVKLFQNPFVSYCAVIVLWVPLEAFLLSETGNTPARFLLGISVRTNSGNNLSFNAALFRSIQVLFQGAGLGIPFVSLFTQIFAYRRLVRTGTTLWDTANDSVVVHKEWGTGRALLCTLAVASVLILAGIGNDYNRQHSKEKVVESQPGFFDDTQRTGHLFDDTQSSSVDKTLPTSTTAQTPTKVDP
jgi:uncharacterized RDD family membrane protein YckC